MKYNKNKDFTLLIAAAGNGTRLGYKAPKILYPIAGRPILDHILDSFSKFVSNIVLVVSPNGKNEIANALGNNREDIHYVIQQNPRGMAEAVFLGLEKCETNFCVCIWGDQPFFSRDAVYSSINILSNTDDLSIVIPVCIKKNSYIHIVFDSESKSVCDILQSREGDNIPEPGITDCSMFFFRVPEMRDKLSIALSDVSLIGNKTKEFNFLPILKKLNKAFLLPVPENLYSSGVNTKNQALSIEKMFKY